MRLAFATHNKHKANEVQKLLPDGFEVMTLDELNILEEIPETGETLQANALIKAKFAHQKLGYNCFADDTGLEVEALNGSPGVYSARYAGVPKNDDANMEKLLANLAGKSNRKARFITSICLFLHDEMFVFEGELKGKIINQKQGANGFGYDPIFVPDGYDITLAQMDLLSKNKISHRAKAINKMCDFLKEQLA